VAPIERIFHTVKVSKESRCVSNTLPKPKPDSSCVSEV